MSIKKIAEKAGVSVSTVSRILNKPDYRCSVPGLREIVWSIAMEMNYVPNEAARNLKKGTQVKESKIWHIHVLMTRTDESRTDPFFTELAKTAQTDPAAAALLAFHKSQKKAGGCEKEQVQKAYEVLADLLKDKNYFVISLCEDGLLEQAGLKENRILTPAKEGEEETDSGVYPTDSWETYTKWLQGTLNRNLVILELGVGMELPQLIRFPFEKVAYFNQKSCLYRVHSHLYQMTEEIKERGYSVPMHPVTLLLEEK